MRRFGAAVAGVLLLVLGVTPWCYAWEFNTKGEFEYRFRYFSRTGDRDLYGRASTQNSTAGTFVGFAGPSFYEIGANKTLAAANSVVAQGFTDNIITRGGFSTWGCDARITDMCLTLRPHISINPAVNAYLVVTAGGFRNKYAMWRNDGAYINQPGTDFPDFSFLNLSPGVPPFERYYMSQSSDAATNTASIFSIEQFFFTVDTPWALFSFGTKRFPIGTGATFARNTREESIYMLVPYGPLNFTFYLFPTEPPRFAILSGTPLSRTELDFFGFRDYSGWSTGPDAETKSTRSLGLTIQYLSGPLDAGVGLFDVKQHLQRGYISDIRGYGDDPLDDPLRHQVFNSFDRETWTGILWTKYANGRFFFNAEYAFSDSDTDVRHQLANTVIPDPFKYQTWAYHLFSTIGVMSGPACLTLMYAQASGPVLSNRVFQDFYPEPPNRTKRYGILPINYQALEPYNYLMFHTYGGGNSVFNLDGTGEMGDARALAARLDYSVAANLNIFGSFIWAKRLERHGYLAGTFGTAESIRNVANGLPLSGAPGNLTPQQASIWKANNGYSGANPFVDDDSIGWEAGIGCDWKLLENITWSTRYAYWKPGKWFTLAYKAFTGYPVNDPRVGTVQGAGVLPERDAIHAIATSVTMGF